MKAEAVILRVGKQRIRTIDVYVTEQALDSAIEAFEKKTRPVYVHDEEGNPIGEIVGMKVVDGVIIASLKVKEGDK